MALKHLVVKMTNSNSMVVDVPEGSFALIQEELNKNSFVKIGKYLFNTNKILYVFEKKGCV